MLEQISDRDRDGPAFRPDIEGLRAVAVVLVVLYHAGIRRVPGGYVGVDVFFVISGFLITRLLTGELAARGTISLAGFYARRVTRLLPAATVVVLATLIAIRYWLPLRIGSISSDALASTYYALNLRLAGLGTDYLGAALPPSPLQHFWSLAVEEQFYLCWPLLLLAVALTGRRRLRSLPIVAVLTALALGSFAASLWLTGTSAPWAFFSAWSRAWELAVGGLVALSAPFAARIPQRAAGLLTWTGLAAVVTAAVAFDDATPFPGTAALLPVAGAAMIILGGGANPGRGAVRLLGRPGCQRVGRLSYAWYLWHWPVLVVAPAALGHDPNRWEKALLIAGSLLLALASQAWVENPLRRLVSLKAKPWRALTLGMALSALVALLATAAPHTLVGPGRADDPTAQLLAAADPAGQLSRTISASLRTVAVPANLTPALLSASADLPTLYDDGCDPTIHGSRSGQACEYGEITSPTSIVLFGDSHAAQWFPGLDKVAKARHWKLVVLTMGSCSAASTTIIDPARRRPYTECVQWRERALQRIRAIRPADVVMSSTDSYPAPVGVAANANADADADRAWADGWRTTIRALTAESGRLVLISDTPRLARDALDCLARHLSDSRRCTRTTEDATVNPRRRTMIAKTAAAEGVTVVDPIPWFCTANACPAVVGNVLVYRDGSHLSTPYSALLAPLLDRQLT